MNNRQVFDRRDWMRLAAGTACGVATSPLSSVLANAAKQSGRHCVLLWMSGGPSQIDTFDMKPGHVNGGTIKPISTAVPGIAWSEHLPRLAKEAKSIAVIRGMSTKEGDHERGTVLMRTGHVPGGAVVYPSMGASLSKSLTDSLGTEPLSLPSYVSISPGPFSRSATGPGFLGPKHAAMLVAAAGQQNDNPGQDAVQGFAQLRVDFMRRSMEVDSGRYRSRIQFWQQMQADFLKDRPNANVVAHDTVYQSAIRMMESEASEAFDLDAEPDSVRESYGRDSFGQGCLMARRLIERGVSMIEVNLGNGLGWDTHADNFTQVRRLSEQLDNGWSALMSELRDRGLLERTTIVWAGEFGRTPKINNNGGRDHFPQAFSCVLAGGGIAGGQVYGATSQDGSEVTDGKMDQQDLLATLCQALGVNPSTEHMADGGRPIRIAEGDVIDELLS
tara:strand:- start:58653 stop:59987 length:1335 start_codon:yes stop_codon:yes gene_type:complete